MATARSAAVTTFTAIIAAALLVGAAAPAAAQFTVVSRAHEVALDNLRLPGSVNGTLAFRPCDTCDYRTLRVTAATEYQVNDRLYDLEDYRRQLEALRGREDIAVTVLHSLETDTIKALRVRY